MKQLFVFCILVVAATLPASAEKDVDMQPYMKTLETKMKAVWHPPKGTETKRVVVYFVIKGDRTLASIHVQKQSGSKAMDDAAMAAVRALQPFPAFPEGAPDAVDIEFTFDYNIGTPMIVSGAQIADSVRAEVDAAMGDKSKLHSILENHAVRALIAKKYESAAKKYASMLHCDPSDALAAKGFADAVSHMDQKIESKDADQLLSDAEKVQLDRVNARLSPTPRMASLRNNEGVRALNAMQFSRAIECFQEALKIDPGYSYAKDNLAISYNNYGLKLPPEQAVACFYKSLVCDPRNTTTAENLAESLAKLDPSKGDVKHIITEQQTRLKADPTAQQHIALGLAYELADDWAHAEAEYKSAAELDRTSDAAEVLSEMNKRKIAHELARRKRSNQAASTSKSGSKR